MMLQSPRIRIAIERQLVSASLYLLRLSTFYLLISQEWQWYRLRTFPSCFKLLTGTKGYLRPKRFHLLQWKVSFAARISVYTYSVLIWQSCDSESGGVSTNFAIALPLAKRCDPVSYPGAGHALNFALNAKGAFMNITDCLSSYGL